MLWFISLSWSISPINTPHQRASKQPYCILQDNTLCLWKQYRHTIRRINQGIAGRVVEAVAGTAARSFALYFVISRRIACRMPSQVKSLVSSSANLFPLWITKIMKLCVLKRSRFERGGNNIRWSRFSLHDDRLERSWTHAFVLGVGHRRKVSVSCQVHIQFKALASKTLLLTQPP